jgi:CubicO group peptidase (beta-lactamase class C family)
MSAGVEWDESYSSLFSKTTQAYYGKDLWKLALTEKLIEKPGVRFNYQSGVSQILAFVLQKATDKNISDYASEKLWTPMEAEEDALWSLDRKDGHEKAYCCFNTNARDFARFGQLILNKGVWDGDQVA